jgi:hypothetical protein
MDELSDILDKADIGCVIGNQKINHLLYADYIVLFSPSVRGLQCLLDITTKYGCNYNMLFNPSKSKSMIIRTPMYKHASFHGFKLGNTVLDTANTFKYLGHIINDKLKDDDDIARQLRCIYTAGNMLTRKFSFCSTDVKHNLFRSYCSCLYTSHLWCMYTKRSINRLHVAYNNYFRMLMSYRRDCSASAMFVNANLSSSKMLVRQSINGFVKIINDSDNINIKSILSSEIYFISPLSIKWENLVYTCTCRNPTGIG